MAGNDYIQVQLTIAGAQAAGIHPFRVQAGRRAFVFSSGQSQRVERSYEWGQILAKLHTPTGEPLFELAPPPPATPAKAAPAAPQITEATTVNGPTQESR